MEREIKFRAWDANPHLEFDEECERMYSWETLSELDKEGMILLFDILLNNEKFISPMQYTGLKDKNGTEIYEGDILEFEFIKGQKRRINFVMKWSEKDAGWFKYEPKEKAEIIGNIYENPEFLTSH